MLKNALEELEGREEGVPSEECGYGERGEEGVPVDRGYGEGDLDFESESEPI